MEKNNEKEIITSLNSDIDDILCSEGRILYVYGDIEFENMNELNKRLIYLNLKDPKSPITIYINSVGGDFLAAISVCDVMTSLKAPIKTIALGECESAALEILASGTYGLRCATKNCIFMTHRLKRQSTSTVDSDEMSLIYKDFRKLEKLSLDILSKYRKENREEFQKIYDSKVNYFFDSKKAKEYKLIDKII